MTLLRSNGFYSVSLLLFGWPLPRFLVKWCHLTSSLSSMPRPRYIDVMDRHGILSPASPLKATPTFSVTFTEFRWPFHFPSELNSMNHSPPSTNDCMARIFPFFFNVSPRFRGFYRFLPVFVMFCRFLFVFGLVSDLTWMTSIWLICAFVTLLHCPQHWSCT